MPRKTDWTEEKLSLIRDGRAADPPVSWDALSEKLGLSHSTIIEKARALGIKKNVYQGAHAQADAGLPSAEPKPAARTWEPLRAGHPLTWEPLNAGFAFPEPDWKTRQ